MAMIALLSQRLAEVIDLSLQAKQAHWNVKGPNFIALHELFDKAAKELVGLIDGIAERAVEFGGVALGTVQSVATTSRLAAYPLDIASGKEHFAALSKPLPNVGAAVRSAINADTNAGDAATADLFTETLRSVDKLLWLIEAHSQASE